MSLVPIVFCTFHTWFLAKKMYFLKPLKWRKKSAIWVSLFIDNISALFINWYLFFSKSACQSNAKSLKDSYILSLSLLILIVSAVAIARRSTKGACPSAADGPHANRDWKDVPEEVAHWRDHEFPRNQPRRPQQKTHQDGPRKGHESCAITSRRTICGTKKSIKR